MLNLKGLYRIFLDLQKMSLVCRECGTPHTRCPLWSMGHVFGIITSQPLSSPPYSPSGDAKSSSLGLIHGNLHHYPATAHQVHAYTINIIRDYCMIFSILAVVSARDSHIKPGSESGGLTPRTIWQILCHNLFITYFTLTFFKH